MLFQEVFHDQVAANSTLVLLLTVVAGFQGKATFTISFFETTRKFFITIEIIKLALDKTILAD